MGRDLSLSQAIQLDQATIVVMEAAQLEYCIQQITR
jgi:hypothetical protein